MDKIRARVIHDIQKQAYEYWLYVNGPSPVPGISKKEQIKIQAYSAEYYLVARQIMGLKEEDYEFF